ncbi:MAG: UDP-N-acetylmuramoyl-L-alanine--D-glutamate ligase [Lachnospiraceae bacterium]|jgi:UDP-N-acetylmuramoylalanine--D-glutamate ligase|nr:UDP-N-acetylmuramoyl-L-alanine--D-glutamate ligase [Lachnospiraceae bacterium]
MKNNPPKHDFLREMIKDKRVLLLGFGVEGQSSYQLLRKLGGFAQLAIADMKPQPQVDSVVHSGADYLAYIEEYDLVFKSPGIILPRKPHQYKCVITSQTEVFLQIFRKQIIGITGTKGKSTVATLLHHVLSQNGIAALLAGNIGTPVFDIIDEITPETVLVVELSCHQLEYADISPSTAVLLNIFEDHLDRYQTLANYTRTKKNIYLHQQSGDIFYYGKDVITQVGEIKTAARTVAIEAGVLPFSLSNSTVKTRFCGSHNTYNTAFVYEIAGRYGVNVQGFMAAFTTFTPLRHRCEWIGEVAGVDFYDDSISTTVESTIYSLKSVENAATVLVGGMDRGINYTNLVSYLAESGLENIICMGESGKRIHLLLTQQVRLQQQIHYSENLYDAVTVAKQVTRTGTACLLSPAAASYGEFRDFRERGDVFRELVLPQSEET